MSNDNDVLEPNSQEEYDSVNIVDLLEIANSKVYDDEEGLVNRNKDFEKVSSFFDLIKSSDNEDQNVALSEQVSEASIEELSDEEGSPEGNSLEEPSDNEQIELTNSENTEIKSDSEEVAAADTITEPGLDNSEISGEEEISSEEFEPLDVIEQSLETVEKLKSQDEREENQVDELSEEYNRGYQDALSEFEKTMDAEKKAISNFGSTLLSIQEDTSKIIEELIKEKLLEISNEFLGKQVSAFPKDFYTHIENISSSIVSNTSEIIVELNEIDAAALKSNIKLEQLAFKIKEVSDLGRAEFRIIAGKAGYEQKIAD